MNAKKKIRIIYIPSKSKLQISPKVKILSSSEYVKICKKIYIFTGEGHHRKISNLVISKLE